MNNIEFLEMLAERIKTAQAMATNGMFPVYEELKKVIEDMRGSVEFQLKQSRGRPDPNDLAKQLKTVTDELVMQIALRFNTPDLDHIRAEHPIVRNSLDILKQYNRIEPMQKG